MEKYGVEIDPDKREKEKRAGARSTFGDDPNINVPIDPEKGTEPYERRPDAPKEENKH